MMGLEMESKEEWYARRMDSLTTTRKLFHVVVVLGMGAAAGVTGCSGDDTTGQNDAAAPADASKDQNATVDAAPKPDGSATADACAGWAPCC